MNKKIIIVASIVVVLLFACLVVSSLLGNKGDNDLPEQVVVKKYILGTNEIEKEVIIDSKEEIRKLSKYVSKLKPLSEHEMVRLALLQEIDIIYNDSISISVQLSEEGYCYYDNKDENISSLSKMPKGLIDWINDNLELEG